MVTNGVVNVINSRGFNIYINLLFSARHMHTPLVTNIDQSIDNQKRGVIDIYSRTSYR